ncbi:MAG: hypothetical protein ABIJ43_01710 [Candidatus Beckwithbacteria bacterium]|nr:hypothetical protein [Patescibacteria group bacterium]
MKKLKILIPVFIVLAILGGVIFFKNKNKKEEAPKQIETRKIEQINKLALKDRPFVTLTPRSDGKEVTLSVDKVTNATTAEYELEYQTDTLIQGVFGTLDFNDKDMPLSKDLLFGSCSKGKCRYDEGVIGGSLTMRFDGGDEPYTLKSDFNLQNMVDKKGVFTSKDLRATLDVGTSLSSSAFVLIAHTMGLPDEVKETVMAGPYAFLSATSPVLKNTIVTFKSNQDLTGAKILFWDGNAWEELEVELSEGQISAPTTSLGTFVLVK